VSTAIRRDNFVDFVIGNDGPFAIDLDFVVIANHTTLGRTAIHHVAAPTLSIISFEL
jgi:hypothetical protein